MGTKQSSEKLNQEEKIAPSNYVLSKFENDFNIFLNNYPEDIANYYKKLNNEVAAQVTVGLRTIKDSGLTTNASKVAIILAAEHALKLALALADLHDAGVEITNEMCMLLLKKKKMSQKWPRELNF